MDFAERLAVVEQAQRYIYAAARSPVYSCSRNRGWLQAYGPTRFETR